MAIEDKIFDEMRLEGRRTKKICVASRLPAGRPYNALFMAHSVRPNRLIPTLRTSTPLSLLIINEIA